MRIYLKQNVLEAALERIRWLFDEFEQVTVGFSGGKDSTVVFNLALQVAREKKRLPLKVIFIDQEAEWEATIEQVRLVMYHPDVEPWWFQVPIKLFNATSTTEHWLQCWDPAEEYRWMRPRDPIARTENVYGTDRFVKLFTAITNKEFAGTRNAHLAGVRCEESPTRFMGLTSYRTYKWATWGNVANKKLGHYVFYPLYDWSYMDIWKAIHSHGWAYNRIYDAYYCYGVPVRNMRVSNVHHETAVHSLFHLQEIEPRTYERLTQRIAGIDMAGKLGKADFFVRDLPPMFGGWREYRDFLLEKLISDESWKEGFRKTFKRQEEWYHDELGDELFKVHVSSILTNDWEGVKLWNFEHSYTQTHIRKRKREAMGLPGRA